MGDIYTNPPQSRNEAIIRATIDGTEYTDPPQSRMEDLLLELKEAIEAGGGVSAFSKFNENIDIDYAFDETTDANYTIIRIYKDKCDEQKQYPFVFAPNGAEPFEMTTCELSKKYGWLLAINGGVFNTSTHAPIGALVQNGVVLQNTPSADEYRPLVIDNNGMLSEAAYNADAEQLVENGAISVVCGFMAIIKDYEKVDSSTFPDVAHFAQNVQRQIIGQFGNGDYAIITCEGRGYQHSDGWTIAEAQDICVKHGLKFAYNLDGGGSTETMLGLKQFNSVYEGTTGRKVPTFIVFNGKPEMGKILLKIDVEKETEMYALGETIDTTDIIVTAYYSDGTHADVTSEAIIDTSRIIPNTPGRFQIEVSYTFDGLTDTKIIDVFVSDTSTFVVDKRHSITASDASAYKPAWGYANERVSLATKIPSGVVLEWSQNTRYLIPIPEDATRVDLSSPLMLAGMQFYDAEGNRTLDPGWGSISRNTRTFAAGTYAYFASNFKYPDNSPTGNADVSKFYLVFS